MTPERWQRVKRLLELALECDPAERATLLDNACHDDPQLRIEVESLIESHEEARSLFDSPPLEAAASLFADDRANLIGRNIGHFKIISELGRGGMGEVFLAQDARLGRRVALKLLPAFYTRDEERLRRFELEARSASALNHPNIVTIFEVGELEGIHFIATEFVEGETLRAAMKHARMNLVEILDACSQAANALAAAHAAGIVHRDIKPENIMLRPDRYVKVVDFGLAKLAENQTIPGETAPTVMRMNTDPGTIVGTAYYMSPEQARGLSVDARTDIFSLGTVLYEMLTGRLPFQGDTPTDVVASILKSEPAPLARFVQNIPPELQRIVGKALRKDRDERYQSVRDLMVDLRSLTQELELGARLERATPLPGDTELPTPANKPGAGTGETLAVATTGATSPTTTSSAEIILSEIKRHKTGAGLFILAVILIIAGLSYGLYKLSTGSRSASPFQTMKLTPFSATGNAAEAAISPDGKYVAYAIEDDGQQSLWLKQTATGSNVSLTRPAKGIRYRGLTFSRDGNYLYYLKREGGNTRAVLYQIPTLGGEPRALIEDVSTDNSPAIAALSPDGKQIAVVRSADVTRSLLVMNTDGSGERTLLTAETAGKGEYVGGAAWSPDGKTIACIRGTFGFGRSVKLLSINVADGAEKIIPTEPWARVNAVVWLPDGSGLLLSAARSSAPMQLWHVSYPSGEVRRITNDLNSYSGVSLTADASTLVTVQRNASAHLWLAPGAEPNRAQRVTNESSDYDQLCWTPDGRILFESAAGDNNGIWSIKADGSGKKHLTADAMFPIASPDGRYVYFASERGAKPPGHALWRMDSDGSHQTQLLTGSELLGCSPDSQWVVYSSRADRQMNLWKLPAAGGEPVRLTDKNFAERPVVSPDGQWIACNYLVQEPGAQFRIAFIPFAGGDPVRVFDVLGFAVRELHWTPDSRAITYMDTRSGVSNIWAQPIDGGPPKQLTDFQSDHIYEWAWSLDGKQLAISRGPQTSDVVLISDFR